MRRFHTKRIDIILFLYILLLFNQFTIKTFGINISLPDIATISTLVFLGTLYPIRLIEFKKWMTLSVIIYVPVLLSLISCIDYISFSKDFVQLFILIPSCLFVGVIINYYTRYEQAIKYIIYASIFSSFIAIIQFLILYFFDTNILSFFGDTYTGKDTTGKFIQGFTRVSGLFQHFNVLGSILIPGIIFSFFRKKYIAAAICLLGVFSTSSRSSILAVFIVMFIYILLSVNFKKKLKYLGLLILSISVIAFLFYSINPEILVKRFSFLSGGTEEYSVSHRLFLYLLTIELAIDVNPITGIGFGNFFHYTGEDSPESSLLLIFVELGLLGLFIFFWIWVYVIKSNYSIHKELSLSILALLISFLVQPFMFIRGIGNLFWLLISIGLFTHLRKLDFEKNRNIQASTF